MIKWFHNSLKSALHSHLASSDWFLHLPLVLLGLRTVPKYDTGLSVSEAIYGSPLTVPGEFLGSPELPPSAYLSKIEQAVAGFAVPLPHHAPQSPPRQLQAALLSAKFFVCLRGFLYSFSSTLVPWSLPVPRAER